MSLSLSVLLWHWCILFCVHRQWAAKDILYAGCPSMREHVLKVCENCPKTLFRHWHFQVSGTDLHLSSSSSHILILSSNCTVLYIWHYSGPCSDVYHLGHSKNHWTELKTISCGNFTKFTTEMHLQKKKHELIRLWGQKVIVQGHEENTDKNHCSGEDMPVDGLRLKPSVPLQAWMSPPPLKSRNFPSVFWWPFSGHPQFSGDLFWPILPSPFCSDPFFTPTYTTNRDPSPHDGLLLPVRSPDGEVRGWSVQTLVFKVVFISGPSWATHCRSQRRI